MAILRTPEHRFGNLPRFDYPVNRTRVGEPTMAYVDVGEGDDTFLCLHGEPTWSFLYRKMIPLLAQHGRVVAPDFPGFGRSDKYDRVEEYSFGKYVRWLHRFVEQLELSEITLVCQDWGGLIGLTYAAQHPGRFARLVPMNTGLHDGTDDLSEAWWEFRDFVDRTEDLPVGIVIRNAIVGSIDPDVIEAYEAPFPEPRLKAGARAWPLMVPTDPSMDGASAMRTARERLREWERPAFVLFSDSDPITRPARDELRELIPTASREPDLWIEGAGHFLQEERGEEVARRILQFVDRNPL